MSGAKTSEHFHGQDEYHRAYFHDIDAPAPLKADRVDPNLPTLAKEEVVDPELPGAPTKSGREDEAPGDNPADEVKSDETKASATKTRAPRATSTDSK